MRIVVDTNVIVSALVFGGVPRLVLDLALTGVCSFYFSKPLQAEVERILAEKFGWSPGEIHARARTIWNLGTEISPQVSLAVVTNDPDDDSRSRVCRCRRGERDHFWGPAFAQACFVPVDSDLVAPAVSRPPRPLKFQIAPLPSLPIV